ncbi:MAG: aminotransferase class V-fold PLP-dependent enzyme [Candidatus Thorarchaeota archaeon]
MAQFDIKSDFQIFENNPDLAYFDSASTTLIPKISVDATCDFLNDTVASARRGAHHLAVKGSTIVEDCRRAVANFLDTKSNQISFQKSIPSAIASFALGYDWSGYRKNQILVAQSEEHSVLVALQRVSQILDLQLDMVPVDNHGVLDLGYLNDLISTNTGIVAAGSTTIGIGVKNPIETIAKITHENGALLLSDITRSIGFHENSPTKLGSDFLIFSGNINLMGPPGLAVQWIEESLGTNHIPAVLGGSSVANVESTAFEIALQPDKFESGTLNLPAIAGLGLSISYLNDLRNNGLVSHIQDLTRHMLSHLKNIPNMVLYGNPTENNTTIGFNLGSDQEISCHDVALFLDESDIAVRSGLLCAHPLIKPIAPDGLIQISFHGYNTQSDVNRLVESLTLISEQLI